MRLSIIGLVVALLLAAISLTGCNSSGGASSLGGNVRAVTSLEIFADMVRNVGGDRVQVTALLPPGADPHTFELTPSRARDIVQADVAFINGLGLEASFESAIRTNANGPVVELTAGLPTLTNDQGGVVEGGDQGGAANPHLWLDVRLGARYVEKIRDALIAQDPAGRAVYQANADAYLQQLGDLDREMERTVLSIAPERRKLVTFHDAYPYLAARYDLQIVAVAVPSPGQEPSAQRIAELTRTLRSQGVPAVYKEPEFNAAVLEQAANEAGVRVLDLLSDAYADGVGSYIELIRFDMQQLKEGLGGS